MKKTLLSIVAVGALVAAVVPASIAKESKDDGAVVQGKGLCAKCELGKTGSCQNAIQTKKDGKTVTYYLAKNEVSDDFHGKICKKTAPVAAKGKVKKEGGKKVLYPKKIAVQKGKTLQGKALCAKCALKKADSCQMAVQTRKDGQTVTYLVENNKVAKDFHSNICRDTAKVSVKGLAAELGDTHVFTAKDIKKQ